MAATHRDYSLSQLKNLLRTAATKCRSETTFPEYTDEFRRVLMRNRLEKHLTSIQWNIS